MAAIHRFTGRLSSRPTWITGALIGTALLTLAVAQLAILSAAAETPATDAFQRTWARTDQPVANGNVLRTWMWGPQANTGALQEPYDDAPGGMRTVQYYDKSRMEDAAWSGATEPWDVTNGLLVVEMVTGQLQLGDTHFEAHDPATVNIAGDPGSQPTYADIAAFGLRDQPATAVGTTLTTWVDGSGIMATAPADPPANVTAAERLTVEGIDHTVASVFWDFMNSSGLVQENGELTEAPLFQNSYYATGYPITEAYWSQVMIGGEPTTVLWQCFERRCLTFNAANQSGWQVEAGNVGQHYYAWRSSLTSGTDPEPEPNPTEPPILTPTPGPDATTFTDGSWTVGKDIEAGTYRSGASGVMCYWERLSGFGGTIDDIIANDINTGRAVVSIDASDTGFFSEGCGTWSTDLSAITTSPTADFGDGTWIVSVDVGPGTWRNSDSSEGCYWERQSDFTGDLDGIIANEFSTSIQTVTISGSDAAFTSKTCGTWTRIGD
ncbi:MAG: hypothetical protein M9890_04785 [Thermomicrobiales bacterium]|nr:hypothetical protein [Thermomicrobiales bacterium]